MSQERHPRRMKMGRWRLTVEVGLPRVIGRVPMGV